MAVIIGIDFAFKRGWNNLWLESDCTSVLACLSSSDFLPPWPLRIPWYNCMHHIRSMTFRCSHVLREGNTVADGFANLGLASLSLIWHASPPRNVSHSLQRDILGYPYYRVN